MAFQPFQKKLCGVRAIALPTTLDADARARLVAKLAAAVKQQAALADKCPHILRVGDLVDEGARILIPHERASPMQAAMLLDRANLPDIDTLWWLTGGAIEALQAAEEAKVLHGGILPGTLYLDELGCLKLGDFGIAPAYEAAFGLEARRFIHCDTSQTQEVRGRVLSGIWSQLSEDEQRETGWVAALFAPELLDDRTRMSLKSDQFSLAALLYICATGAHPYGAELADPTINFYAHFEPLAPNEERAEWKKPFEREEGGVADRDDRKITAWWSAVVKMLATDASDRPPAPRVAVEDHAEHILESWKDAARAESEAEGLLRKAKVDDALARVAKFTTEDALPELARTRLGEWVKLVESQREVIGRRKKLEQRLREGHQALEGQDWKKARAIAEAVRAAPEAEATLKKEADELLGFCAEQEQFEQSHAHQIAESYLESARDHLARGDYADAKMILNELLRDEGTSKAAATAARTLLGEAEMAEQRAQHQREMLQTAQKSLGGWKLAEAERQVVGLLEEEGLSKALVGQARALLDDVRARQKQRGADEGRLAEARRAWEAADAAAMQTALTAIGRETAPELDAQRNELLTTADALRGATELQRTATARFEKGDFAAGQKAAQKAAALPGLPAGLVQELKAFAERCRARSEEVRQGALQDLNAALNSASAYLDAGDDEQCRTLLETTVMTSPALDEASHAQARALLGRCEQVQAARKRLKQAEHALGERKFDDALALIAPDAKTELPEAVLSQQAELRERIEAGRAKLLEARRAELRKQLDRGSAALEEGRLDDAEKAAQEVESSPHVSEELREAARGLRTAVLGQRPLVEALDECEQTVKKDPAAAGEILDRLPGEVPPWAAARIEKLRRAVEKVREQRRKEALVRVEAGLSEAQAALDAGDAAKAKAALEGVRKEVALQPDLAARFKALGERLPAVEEWSGRIAPLRKQLADGDALTVHKAAVALLKPGDAPEFATNALKTLARDSKAQVENRRKAIDEELARLEAALQQSGRKARRLPQQAAAIVADPLAGDAQRKQAEELAARYAALPVPKTPVLPIAAAAGFVVLAGAGAAWYFTRPPAQTLPVVADQGNSNGPIVVVANDNVNTNQNAVVITPPDDGPKIAAAQERLRGAFAAAWRGDGRFELEFSEGSTFPKTVSARSADGARHKLAEVKSLTELEGLAAAGLTSTLAAALPNDNTEIVSTENANDNAVVIATANTNSGGDVPIANDNEAGGGTQPQVPTLAEATELYLTELRNILKRDLPAQSAALAVDGRADRDGLRIGGKWSGAELLPVIAAFDEARGAFTIEAADVASDLAEQIDLLEALAGAKVAVRADPAYDALLAVAGSGATLTIQARGSQPGTWQVSVPVKLGGVEGAPLPFSGQVVGNTLNADEASRAALAKRIQDLQTAAAAGLAQAVARAIELPEGVTASLGTPGADGAQIVEIKAGATLLGTIPASWIPKDFAYAPDTNAGVKSLVDGVQAALDQPALARPMQQAWQAQLEAISPKEDEAGAAYVREAAVRSVVVKAPAAAEFPREALLTVGPAASTDPADLLEVPVRVTWKDGTPSLSPADAATAKAVVAGQVAKLAQDEGFRQRRQDEAIKSAQADQRAERGPDGPPKITPGEDGALELEFAGEGKSQRYRLTWDASRLAFSRERIEAERSMEAQLATARGEIPARDFVRFLSFITSEKAKDGKIGFRVSFPASADPSEQLLTLSRDLQVAVIAGAPPPVVTPNVFIEFWVGAQNVYALSWRTSSDGKRVEGLRVATLLESAKLPKGDSPEWQSLYRDPKFGENVLGAALGGEIPVNSDGSFGLVIAPDGPLWMTRWEQVKFSPRPVKGLREIGGDQTLSDSAVDSLRTLLRPRRPGQQTVFRAAGIWCFVTLAGEADRNRPELGADSGLKPTTRPGFEKPTWWRGKLRIARILSGPLPARPWEIPEREQWPPQGYGYRFWDYGWSIGENESWSGEPYVGFGLIRMIN